MAQPIIIRRSRRGAVLPQLQTPSLSVSSFTDTQINLSWLSISADTYYLYRSLYSDFSNQTLVFSGSALSFNDTGLTSNTTYYYRLKGSKSGFIDSAYSSISETTEQAAFDIGSLGSTILKHWYKDATDPANYIDTTLPGFAEQWTDSSGNAQNLVQTTAANKPQITDEGMLADATTLLRDSSVPSLDTDSGELSFYIVCKVSTSSANLARLLDINGTNRFVIQYTNSGGNIRFFTYINSVQYLLTAPFDGYLVLSIHKTSSRGIIQSNDSTKYTDVGMGRITATDFSLFATNAAASSMIGHIREVVVAQGLTPEDKDNVLYELLRRYRSVSRPTVTNKGIELHYSNTNYTYDAGYPGKNVIRVGKVVDDTTDGSTPAANTGLTYDLENNLPIVFGTPGSFVKATKWNRDLTVNTVTTTQITQGGAYNSVTGDYYELLTTGINVKDTTNNITKTLTFPSTQAAPGMLFFHQHTQRFYCSYDGGSDIKVWTPDFTANTLTIYQTIASASEEGAAVSYIDNTIWNNRANQKVRIDHNGNLLWVFPFAGNTGAENEGLIVDPTDGTIWFNSDEYFHGTITDGNRLWHVDPMEVYDKYLRIPDQIRYEWGFLSGLSIVGKYGESYLSGSGTWESPIIDFESFNMHQVLANYKIRSGYNVSFRSSGTAPTTTAITIFPRPYYDNNAGTGWGSTVPSSYSSDPTGLGRYVQIKITI